MQAVKIKNLNKSHMKKAFIVKGRIKYLKVENNRNSNGKHLNSILFDDSSEIEVVAFKNCDEIYKLLCTENVVQIENCMLREVNKDYKKTKHKYKIILESNSIITIINNDEVNNDDFPIHKFTSGASLKTLIPGMIIDVIGVCTHFNSEKAINTQSQTFRKGFIKVDSTEIEVRFYGEKAEELYEVGSTLFLCSVTYINFKGCEYLSVGHSSTVKSIPPQLSNIPDLENSITGLSNHRLSISRLSSSNKSSVIELPDQIPSTSSLTPSNKRKIQDFNVEEVIPKILKIAEPEETVKSFSDEEFVNVVLKLLGNVNNELVDKNVVKLRIIEFILEILPKNNTQLEL